ncbi:MAG: antibiotic biosynthesis monooxygenase [Hyphomicrobiales bacterium]
MGKARLLVELDVVPNQVDAFISMFHKEFISRSRQENGCEIYELWQDPSSVSKMTIVEVWSSQSALDAHLAQPWLAIWAPKMEAMQATPLVVRSLVSTEV